MAKEVKDTKWDKFAGGILKDSQMVDLFIPVDRINKSNFMWVSLNGDECYLATGKRISVPKEIYDIVMDSINATAEAEAKINTENTI